MFHGKFAVIADKNNVGVFVESGISNCLKQLSNDRIHFCNHGKVDSPYQSHGVICKSVFPVFIYPLVLVNRMNISFDWWYFNKGFIYFIQIVTGRSKWRMRYTQTYIEKKWAIAGRLFFNPFRCLFNELPVVLINPLGVRFQNSRCGHSIIWSTDVCGSCLGRYPSTYRMAAGRIIRTA